MLRLALIFLLIALLSGLFGFGLVADMAFQAARILFVVFLVLAVLTLIVGYQNVPLD
ncbi:MAG TPA: DUF1328 family protein [Gemmataceae bacterium]|nr:DUF1328 family protein [Gemmataceae bacterium]